MRLHCDYVVMAQIQRQYLRPAANGELICVRGIDGGVPGVADWYACNVMSISLWRPLSGQAANNVAFRTSTGRLEILEGPDPYLFKTIMALSDADGMA